MSLQKLTFVFVLINSLLICNSAYAVKTYAEASAACTSLPASNPEIDAELKACMGKASIASNMCFEGTSPSIKTGMTVVGSVLSAVKMASPADACSGFAKAMDTARNVISAFNLACGGAHALCDSNCSTVIEHIAAKKAANLAEIKTQEPIAANVASPATAAAAQAEITRLTTENAGLVKAKACTATLQKTCNSYSAQLTAGAAGILGLVIQSQAADTCNTKLSPSPTPVDCKIVANATLAQCICEKTPRATGCDGYKSSASSSADHSSNNSSTTTSNKTENGGGGGDFGGGGDSGNLPAGSSGSGGGGSASGGGKGIDGGLGSAGGAAKKDAAQKKGINTNILGGDYGGGGGSRGGGRSSSEEAMQSQYKNFLPGEKNDPMRNVANDSAAGPLTGSGGKTNWDKVRERYDDNY